jgi:AcrR family transcriptional regulator
MPSASVPAPRRGRPRSEKAAAAILDSAVELLLNQGLEAVSMDTIAERAGVSKATIYRWWPTKETLALDALFYEWAHDGAGDPANLGDLREDLLALLEPWMRRVTARPYARVLSALITRARTDPAFAREYDTRLVQPRRARARLVLERAVARGEVSAETDLEAALDLIYGPLYLRLLQGHLELDERFVVSIVDLVLAALRA